jgi:hypothetical protein
MSHLRLPFPSLLVPIEVDMDCGAVTRPFRISRSTFLRIRYRLSIGFMVRCYVPSAKGGETTLEFVMDMPIRCASTRPLVTVRRVLLLLASSDPRATGSITWLTGTRAQILWRLRLSNLGCNPGGSSISRLRIYLIRS